jgi:hypothetical protein
MSQVTPMAASADKRAELFSAVFLGRCGMWPAGQAMPEGAEQHRNASLCDFLEADLRARGRNTDGMTREDIASEALQIGSGVQSLPSVHSGGGSYQRPGDYPNLLANIMGTVLDEAMALAEPTYPLWTKKLSDVADFQAKTIIALGGFDELNLVEDDDPAESINASEEVVGWIKVDRYNGKAGLTPVMIANDDVDGFTHMLMSLADAHENTLNRLCVELIATNPLLLSGTELFHADHNNDVVAGAPPSATQGSMMWQQWHQQTAVGNPSKTIRTPPAIILYPAILDYTVKQIFAPFAGMVENKQAATDANLNILRGQFDFVREPELDAYSSLMWYWLADPRRRQAFVHMFQRGYGRGGRRTTWFDPDRETRYVKIEGRFGAANAGHRGVLRNQGEDNT